jgi:polyhydroxyalkanoate synthesis regulator phasin
MNEQRRQILEMLAEGKINADEAERLIAALERDRDAPALTQRKGRPKYLRVVVDDRGDGEPSKVNVRVPIQLLRAGVRLATLVPPRAIDRANDELERAGVGIDLSKLKPEQIEELIDHLDEMTIDVEDADSTIHVFCE